MKIGILVFVGAFLGSFSALADVGLVGLVNPLATLQRGVVHFQCRELGQTNGFGLEVMKFNLSVLPSKVDPTTGAVLEKYPLQIADVQRGIQSGEAANYSPFSMKFSNAGGQVLFGGTAYERIQFWAQEENAMTEPFSGETERYKFVLSQDIQTKLVILRWSRTVVKDMGEPNCGAPPLGCTPRQNTIFDNVLICEPN